MKTSVPLFLKLKESGSLELSLANLLLLLLFLLLLLLHGLLPAPLTNIRFHSLALLGNTGRRMIRCSPEEARCYSMMNHCCLPLPSPLPLSCPRLLTTSLTPAPHFPENLSASITGMHVSTDLHRQSQISRGGSSEFEGPTYNADCPGVSYFALFAQDRVLLCGGRSSYLSASEDKLRFATVLGVTVELRCFYVFNDLAISLIQLLRKLWARRRAEEPPISPPKSQEMMGGLLSICGKQFGKVFVVHLTKHIQ